MLNENPNPFEVLLVEDEPADANLVRLALKENKVLCNMHHVLDGVEALAFLRRQEERYRNTPFPDLILLDLNMPKKDGREALKEIKSDPDLRRIPIVVLTTSKAEEDIYRTYDLGVNSFITKPVSFETLVEIMKGLARYWFEIVELPSGKKGA